MASAKSRKRKGKARVNEPFTVKHRQEMLLNLEGKDYGDLVEAAVSKLEAGLHLRRYEERGAFVKTISHDPVRPTLVQCLVEMIARYIEIYKQCMKGKRYALFEQRWLQHTHEYFESKEGKPTEQARLWTNVVVRAEQRGAGLCVSEQRLVVSTIAYHVHDLMAEKVQKYKTERMTANSSPEEEEVPVSKLISESNVALFRYGGFALHSMIRKRLRHTTRAHAKDELDLLNKLKVKKDEWDDVPPAIQQLTRGGLDVPSPSLLPLLRKVVETTSSLVNPQMSIDHGRNMIEIAKRKLDEDHDLKETFHSIAPPNFSCECKTSVLTELVHKVFHARVNEYMNASEEIELEREGKAVKAEQSLRDTLKTFSGMSTRTV